MTGMTRNAETDRPYRLVIAIMAGIFRLMFLRITVRGAEHLPSSGAAVVASNHIGFIDFTFVGYAARERHRFVRFMCKRSAFDAPVAGRLLRAMGHIAVGRPSGAVAFREGLRRLRRGEIVGLFPEATISRSFQLRPFKEGAAALALQTGAPLIPLIIWGSQRIATVDGRRSWRPGKAITITVGAPIEPDATDTYASLTAKLRTEMTRLLDQSISSYPQAPRNESDRWWLPRAYGGTAPDVETGLRLDQENLARIGQEFD